MYTEFKNQLEIDKALKKHTTQELWQLALHDPVLAPQMQGVFPSNKLPVIKTYPPCLMSNLKYRAPRNTWNPQRHHVFYFTRKQWIFWQLRISTWSVWNGRLYFIKCNHVQWPTSSRHYFGWCGKYLLHRAKNKDLNTFATKFRINDSQWNDAQVAQFVQKHVRTLRQVIHSTTIQCDVNQCCRTYERCR